MLGAEALLPALHIPRRNAASRLLNFSPIVALGIALTYLKTKTSNTSSGLLTRKSFGCGPRRVPLRETVVPMNMTPLRCQKENFAASEQLLAGS